MDLSVQNINTYANRLQEPRQAEQREMTGQVQQVQQIPSGQQSEEILQAPSRPALRTGDVVSLDSSNQPDEKYALYASESNALKRDIGNVNVVFSSGNARNTSGERMMQSEPQSETVTMAADERSNAGIQQPGAAVQNNAGGVQEQRNMNSSYAGGENRGNTAFPEAYNRNSGVVSALAGYRESLMQTQPVPTIDQTV